MTPALYAIGPVHHGIGSISDEHGIVASFEIETQGRFKPVWRIEADPVRFPPGAVLPVVFAGKPIHELDDIADVYGLFGIAVPGSFLRNDARRARAA